MAGAKDKNRSQSYNECQVFECVVNDWLHHFCLNANPFLVIFLCIFIYFK
jgi:hypothetical protein